MASLIIDGVEYPAPNPATFTIGQARIIYRYSGLTLQQVEDADPSDPNLMAAFCHLALLETHTGRSFAEIEKVVDKIQFAKLDFAKDKEGEERPPVSSQNANGATPPPSGPTSVEPSARTPDKNPLPTGTPA
jgi:hypothetical protein